MEIRGSRLVLIVVGLSALALCIGSVSAKPTDLSEKSRPKASQPFIPGQGVGAIDPAVTKRITPQVTRKDMLLDLQKRAAPEAYVPTFNVKRLEALERAQLLGATEPAALPGPRVFDARTNYHDDQTYMELLAYNGASAGVRPLRNYFHFMGSDDVMASPYTRPALILHFRAQPGTRYLLECAVDASDPTNFYATDDRGMYAVHSSDKATLLYMRDQTGSVADVVVNINGDRPGWYLDGCELTASAR